MAGGLRWAKRQKAYVWNFAESEIWIKFVGCLEGLRYVWKLPGNWLRIEIWQNKFLLGKGTETGGPKGWKISAEWRLKFWYLEMIKKFDHKILRQRILDAWRAFGANIKKESEMLKFLRLNIA